MDNQNSVPNFPELEVVIRIFSKIFDMLGYNQIEFAGKIGISQPSVSRLVGKTRKRLGAVKYHEVMKMSKTFFEEICRRQGKEYKSPMWVSLSEDGEIRVTYGTEHTEEIRLAEQEGQQGRKGIRR